MSRFVDRPFDVPSFPTAPSDNDKRVLNNLYFQFTYAIYALNHVFVPLCCFIGSYLRYEYTYVLDSPDRTSLRRQSRL